MSDDNRRRETLYQAEMEQREAANSSGTDFASNDALLSAEAIRAFAATQLPGTFNNITFRRNSQSLPKLGIEGVDVSVSLDLIARNRMKETVGGAIVQTSKAVSSKSWRDEHSSCVASLVWMLCTKHLKSFGDVDRKLCFAIDVFAKKVTLAPANYKRLLRDIETSCREIAVLWDQIPPPADYVAAE